MKSTIAFALAVLMLSPSVRAAEPSITEDAVLTFAPNVPPPVTRKKPALVKVKLVTEELEGELMPGFEGGVRYKFWTFNGQVPGPLIRVRVGDTIEVALTNPAGSDMPHNVDFHAVTGPGGGAEATTAAPGETKIARFKMMNPGLYTYHCAASPVADHIANGMYGAILVEPEKGLPKVDREFYLMQSEFYTKGDFGDEGLQAYDAQKGASEHPTYIVFNGKVGSLQGAGALKAKVGETIRVYYNNIGPNLAASFHVIGAIFDKVYREGSITDPTRNVQTTMVPAGSSAIVEWKAQVPGNYSIVDHSIFRTQKGAFGILSIEGEKAPEIYRVMETNGVNP